MKKTPEDFIKNIKKLDDYLVLNENPDYLIIGTTIIIKEHKEISSNIFQPYSKNIDKRIYICFIISLTEDLSKLEIFTKMPLLILNAKERNYKIGKLKEWLDDFIKEEFRS